MTTYHDYAFDAADINALLPVLGEANLIGPLEGRADIEGCDPARYYIRIRSVSEITLPAGCTVTAPDVADALLGVWA
jgi:hypothetical protein